MKMNDVFNLPMLTDGSTVYDLRPSIWMGEPSQENNYFFGVQNNKNSADENDKAAILVANAVNSHDNLIEALDMLIDSIESNSGYEPSLSLYQRSLDEAKEALKQAKGEG